MGSPKGPPLWGADQSRPAGGSQPLPDPQSRPTNPGSLQFYVRPCGPEFSSHFPPFFRFEFTLPYCPEQEKVLIFDYFITATLPRYLTCFNYLSGF